MAKVSRIEGVAVSFSERRGPYSIVAKNGVYWFKNPGVLASRGVAWESYGKSWTVVVPKEFI